MVFILSIFCLYFWNKLELLVWNSNQLVEEWSFRFPVWFPEGAMVYHGIYDISYNPGVRVSSHSLQSCKRESLMHTNDRCPVNTYEPIRWVQHIYCSTQIMKQLKIVGKPSSVFPTKAVSKLVSFYFSLSASLASSYLLTRFRKVP